MTLFSKIIKGEIPSFKIAEDDRYYAFLDINQLVKVHTLVVPKKEEDYIFDLDDETLAGMTVFAKRVAKALKKAVNCTKVGITVIGLEVPHAHIHLIPMTKESDIWFSNPKLKPEPAELEKTASLIAGYFE
jgi:histidine triad (HIT) family protein